MPNQNTTQATRRVVRVAVLFLGLILLASGVDQSAALICNSLHIVVRDAAALLPSFVLAAWQILQPAAAFSRRVRKIRRPFASRRWHIS